MSLLTIFTAPKPFTNPHIRRIQRNAIQSWQALGADVEVLVLGEEDGIAQAAAELGFRWIPQVARNAAGTPTIRSLFETARRNSDSPLLAYVNADILLLPDFVEAARTVQRLCRQFLLVGQRWDLDVTQDLDFSEGWPARLLADIERRGKLHTRGGSDYFIYPREVFTEIPDFAVGRAGWDNWMLYEARNRGWALVDATASIRIIHQNHDYSHLPGGQAHYRQPETFENIRLAGGRRVTRFTLADVEYELVNGQLQPYADGWDGFWRELEITPLVKLHSRPLAGLFEAVFHPRQAYGALRRRMSGKEPE
jgi:hypothetical protein